MKPRFLVDQNLSPKTVVFLRKLGYNAKRVDEVGLGGAKDSQIAEFALAKGMVIITLDKDFAEMYYFSGRSAGTIVIRTREPSVERVNALLESLLKHVDSSRLHKVLVLANEGGYRIMRKPE